MKKIKLSMKNVPNHVIVAISAWISKIIIALIQVINVRVLLDYLDEDKYAVYVIAYSLIGWFNLAEFGVGISLQNFISESQARKESYEKYIVAALQIVVVLFAATLLITIFISSPIQNIIFRKFSYILEIQSINITLVVGIITLTSCFLSIVFKVYYALHKGYIANLIPAISIVISMIIIVSINIYSQKQGNILFVLLVFTVPQLVLVLFSFIKVFKNYFSRLLEFNISVLKDLIVRAAKFHGTIMVSLAYVQTDYLVISQTLSVNEIVEYNIFMRVFLFFSYAYMSFLAAFWPVSSEMYMNKQFKELKNKIKKHLAYVSLFMVLGTACIMIFSKFIIKTLAPGQNIVPTICFMLLIGIYILAKAWQDTFAMFLQSINVLKIFWIYMPLQVIINLLLQYFLSKIYGVNGIVLGLIISTVCVSVWVLFMKVSKVLEEIGINE
ncbi:MAG: MATE family efflux transporter [Endomicrobium sp.]|jgi:O-antigen/teichoic acid export membrane protein|nr:MATE family efflux transporter [Endomicrobium sp.]